jgi:hypothetical protein
LITHRFNSKGFAIGDTRANIAVENQHKTSEWAILFENFVVTVFICEYLLRGWIYTGINRPRVLPKNGIKTSLKR